MAREKTTVTSLALVHHANQYLITDGYDNREGISAVLGHRGGSAGLTSVLERHRRYRIPLNLHISGTLLEAIAWHHPEFLNLVRELLNDGLVELVGSCYGQNIMRFFGPEYNRKQLDEELWLFQHHLGAELGSVKTFWPPERVWDTRRMAPALRDARLLNEGYRYVIVDDRLLLSRRDPVMPREAYDKTGAWNGSLYQMHEIEDGLGLAALPIATRLRRSIPPHREKDWAQIQSELEGLLVHGSDSGGSDDAGDGLLAVYADDMEKVAGVGEWGREGPERYERFLDWVHSNEWIRPVLLGKWAEANQPVDRRPLELGTFQELAQNFEAGEGYEKWFLAPDWAPFRGHFKWAEERVRTLEIEEADESLIELAEKQLLVANWETAWHTPASGPHGDTEHHGHASPWARALTSHSRQAAVIAEAAWWMKHKDGLAHVTLEDIDNDGEPELVFRNDYLFAVVSPRWGGRIIALFHIGGDRGAMVIGNPCDDWNWMEELNRYMDVPRNHPGALADVGFENDRFETEISDGPAQSAKAILRNAESGSLARGVEKEISLAAGDPSLHVRYQLTDRMKRLEVEFGFSPDYLNLLRRGSGSLHQVRERNLRGWTNEGVSVWIKPLPKGRFEWAKPYQERFGHGMMLRLRGEAPGFDFEIGAGVLSVRTESRRPRRHPAVTPMEAAV